MKKQKGITLIALVITIIILLILAGVTLNIVFNNGLIEKSQTAVETYSKEQAKEKLKLALVEYKMKRLTGESIALNDFLETIEGITVNPETNKVIVDGHEFIVNEETLEIQDENNGTKIPEQSQEPEEKTKYTVIINKGTGIESVTETQDVEEGQSLEITATVTSGYIFNKWIITSGTGIIESETSEKTEVTPTSPITIQATAVKTKVIVNGNNLTGTENGTLTGGEYSYNNPVIPVGFKISNEGASWEDLNNDGIIDGWNGGLVITDKESDGNEFVWVPVHNEDVVENGVTIKAVPYAKWCSTGHVVYDDTNMGDINSPSEITESNQITKYKGFYVARYEAGIPIDGSLANTLERDVEGKPVSKKNQIPWNYITWNNAKINAESMYKIKNSENNLIVKSGLITGTQWDTIMLWVKNSVPTVDVETDSSSWGNNYDSPVTGINEYSLDAGVNWIAKTDDNPKETTIGWLLKTGHTEYTNRKNIYDLSGNLWEFTAETYGSSNIILRSCSYCSWLNTTNSAAFRYKCVTDTTAHDIGYRVVLYIQ